MQQDYKILKVFKRAKKGPKKWPQVATCTPLQNPGGPKNGQKSTKLGS